ncbi:MAG: von Willebrand factor type A domain-containing protein [Planctomycetota bacterium]
MTNENHTTQPLDRRDDPRLTAYVLGELSPEERAAFERELAADPELAAEVRAIESLAGELRGTLAAAPAPALDATRRDTILASARPAPMTVRPKPRLLRQLAIAAGLIALVSAGLWASVRRIESSKSLRGHGYIGPSTGFSEPSILDRVSELFSSEEQAPEAAAPLAAKIGKDSEIAQAPPGLGYTDREHLEQLGYGGGESEKTLSPERLEALKGLGYAGDSGTVSASDVRQLRALGYRGEALASNPNVSANGAALIPPLQPGDCSFQGGVTDPYSLTKEQAIQTYTWRDTSLADGDFLNNDLRGFQTSEPPGTEAYDRVPASPFRDPTREPLSTFSIDVDTASYANVRRFLSERQLPPADAVRIEELVNYFRYDYPEPRGKVPFSVTVDSASVPWHPEHRLVRIGLRGRAPADERPKMKNLVFLVDVSGSMDSPDKLPLVQRSLRLLVDELSPEDRVALVVYAGNSGVVLPSTSVDSRATIHAAIDGLTSGGSTNGGSGIQLAYDMARKHMAKDGVNRVILATDGDFNVGITDRAALLRLIEEERRSGVFLSVLGFGTGNLKDGTMEQLADHGNGNYGYVDSLAEARKLLVREMDATLETIAKDVKIQVEFNPAKVAAYRLVGYENRVLAARDFNDDKKDAGEIGAGHTVTALYEIVPVGVALAASVDPLRYQPTAPRDAVQTSDATSELLTVKLRYKEPSADTSQLLAVPFTDDGRSFDEAGPELRFAASVAAFGLCLRRSEAAGATTLRDVYRWAEPALGKDPHGDRREFLKLVDLAAGLSGR